MTIAATTSNAADLPQQQPYSRAPAAVSPVYDWSGFYIGVMGGYGFADNVTVGNLTVTDAGLKGGFVGGTVGANWQMGQFLIAWKLTRHGRISANPGRPTR
jgi:outer membrane immunogenic protein